MTVLLRRTLGMVRVRSMTDWVCSLSHNWKFAKTVKAHLATLP
ncbi:hypothetical protein ACQP1K_25255 [Sphaerimonospora sp. CA-214678]